MIYKFIFLFVVVFSQVWWIKNWFHKFISNRHRTLIHSPTKQTLCANCDALLDEVSFENHGLLMYNDVRWLSHRNILERCADCLEHIRLFIQNDGKIEQYAQLVDVM